MKQLLRRPGPSGRAPDFVPGGLGLSETMGLTLMIWLCSLVVIGLVVVPLFGLRMAAISAIGLLIALLVVCWGICIYRLPGNGGT